MKEFPALQRQWSLNRVKRVARILGRYDGRSRRADRLSAALSAARSRARSLGVPLDDIDEATIEGLETGRAHGC